MKYSIPELIKQFKEDAEIAEKQRLLIRERHGEPGYDDSFNIALAFLSMCQEIQKLKEDIYDECETSR